MLVDQQVGVRACVRACVRAFVRACARRCAVQQAEMNLLEQRNLGDFATVQAEGLRISTSIDSHVCERVCLCVRASVDACARASMRAYARAGVPYSTGEYCSA